MVSIGGKGAFLHLPQASGVQIFLTRMHVFLAVTERTSNLNYFNILATTAHLLTLNTYPKYQTLSTNSTLNPSLMSIKELSFFDNWMHMMREIHDENIDMQICYIKVQNNESKLSEVTNIHFRIKLKHSAI